MLASKDIIDNAVNSKDRTTLVAKSTGVIHVIDKMLLPK